jgi:hypothetical protein
MFNKKASVFIYILLLINIVLIMWIIVFNNTHIISNNLNFWVNAKEIFLNIYNKWKISIDSVKLSE